MARERSPRTYTLRRASSVVFALISVLPLLLFAYTLYALNVLQQATAQIGLGSALALAMIGFYIYSVMIARLSDILREIEVSGTSASHAVSPQILYGGSTSTATGSRAPSPRRRPRSRRWCASRRPCSPISTRRTAPGSSSRPDPD